jgi:hypothetical protein
MGGPSRNTSYLIVGACFFTVLVLQYYGVINMSLPGHASSSAESLLEHLPLEIGGEDEENPTIHVQLRNAHPSTTFTILKWDTPFDDNPLVLGIVAISQSGVGEQIELPRIMRNRKLPPPTDALLEIPPGATVKAEIALSPPAAKLDAGKTYDVTVRGDWKAVWPRKLTEVTESDLDSLGGLDAAITGNFTSNTISIQRK